MKKNKIAWTYVSATLVASSLIGILVGGREAVSGLLGMILLGGNALAITFLTSAMLGGALSKTTDFEDGKSTKALSPKGFGKNAMMFAAVFKMFFLVLVIHVALNVFHLSAVWLFVGAAFGLALLTAVMAMKRSTKNNSSLFSRQVL